MSAVVDSFPIQNLSPDERMDLIGRLWDSLTDEEAASRISEDDLAEARRRSEELRKHPEIGIPWADVKASILGR
jgi:putative addiction module component (TIGR02574 family)